MTPTVWLFWIMAPHILMPMPHFPAFPDQVTCDRALERADPFLPGKTACWPAPYQAADEPSVTAVPPGEGEHVD